MAVKLMPAITVGLKDYQINTVNAISKKLGKSTDAIVLADEVGLGKTWEVLAIIDKLKKPTLIVTPSLDLIDHWLKVMGKYSDIYRKGIVKKAYDIYRKRIFATKGSLKNSIKFDDRKRILNILLTERRIPGIVFLSGIELKTHSMPRSELLVLLAMYNKNKAHKYIKMIKFKENNRKNFYYKRLRRFVDGDNWCNLRKLVKKKGKIEAVFKTYLKLNSEISNR